jgi:hypothetical protein
MASRDQFVMRIDHTDGFDLFLISTPAGDVVKTEGGVLAVTAELANPEGATVIAYSPHYWRTMVSMAVEDALPLLSNATRSNWERKPS